MKIEKAKKWKHKVTKVEGKILTAHQHMDFFYLNFFKKELATKNV